MYLYEIKPVMNVISIEISIYYKFFELILAHYLKLSDEVI